MSHAVGIEAIERQSQRRLWPRSGLSGVLHRFPVVEGVWVRPCETRSAGQR
jgi:hypothetical protein